MNLKTKLQKTIFFGFLAGLFALNFIILSGTAANATDGGGAGCKWSAETCPDNTTHREICLSDGDGNTCTCGSVTRSCP